MKVSNARDTKTYLLNPFTNCSVLFIRMAIKIMVGWIITISAVLAIIKLHAPTAKCHITWKESQ